MSMNVGIISSKEYLPLARIMLTSLNKSCSEKIELYVFHLDLEDSDFEFINIDKNKISIHPMKIDPSGFDGITVDGHFGLFSYFRLLAPYVLPENMDRIMWLDTDLIIKKDLKDYYNTDFQGKALIASPSVMNQIGKGLSSYLKNKYSVGDDAVYFNAGVLIFNLARFREKYSLDYILKIAHEDQKELKYIDQDILNCLFWDDCLITSQYKYNFSPKDAYYDKQLNKETLSDAYIIHYCGKKKPTDFTYPDLGFDEYWQYAKRYSKGKYYITAVLHFGFDCLRTLKHKLLKK